MQKIEGVELNIYGDEGNEISISLSSTQTLVVFKILGFEFKDEACSMFNDETLNKFMKMKGNPLNLKNKRAL